jgi:serine/threonine protein kinase
MSINSKNTVYPVKRRQTSAMSTSEISITKGKEKGFGMVNQYRILSTLGEGAFGKVKLAIDTKTNSMYAIKIMNKKRLKLITMTQGKTAYDFVL